MEHTDDKRNIGECCSFRGHRGAQQNQNTTTTKTVDTHAFPAFALSSCLCNARLARLPTVPRGFIAPMTQAVIWGSIDFCNCAVFCT